MYHSYSESELIEAYNSMIDYSGKASKEMLTEIELRGGMEAFLATIEINKINKNESDRVFNAIIDLVQKGYSLKEIDETITSEIWTQHDLHEFIENRYHGHQLYLEDKTINREVTMASILGSLVSIIVGSIIWAFSIVVLHTYFYPTLIFIYIIAYLLIKAITRKSRNNIVVFIACFISTLASLFLGTYLYSQLFK